MVLLVQLDLKDPPVERVNEVPKALWVQLGLRENLLKRENQERQEFPANLVLREQSAKGVQWDRKDYRVSRGRKVRSEHRVPREIVAKWG